MTTATAANTCRGCGAEIPATGRMGDRRWCADCSRNLAPHRKAKIEDADMEAKVQVVAERARAEGNARPPAPPMTVRHDPAIVRPRTYPSRTCRGCGKSFTPTAPRQWFGPCCRNGGRK